MEQIKAFHHKAKNSGRKCKRYSNTYNFRQDIRNLDIDKKVIFFSTYVFKNEMLTILFW